MMATTMKRLTYSTQLGGVIFVKIKSYFDGHPSMIADILSHVGRESCTEIDPAIVNLVKPAIVKILEEVCPAHVATAGTEDTVIDTDLLDLWRTASKDPDTEPPVWLKHGAPAGIVEPILDRGIFPLYDPTIDVAEVEPGDLATQADFANYDGVEDDPDVKQEVVRLIKAKHVRRFRTLRDVRKYLGSEPVLSKIGVIKKKRNGKWKCRMVIDSKRSGISKATRKFERTLLPRALES